MNVDYDDPRRAIATQQLLWAAGIDAVYLPYLPLAPGDDPLAVRLFAHRLRVAERDAPRALRVLAERERPWR